MGELGLKSAEEWYHKLMDTQPNEKIEAMIYLNFARYHSLIGNNDLFMTYARKAYQMREKADRVTAAMSTAQVGIALQRQKNMKKHHPIFWKVKTIGKTEQ